MGLPIASILAFPSDQVAVLLVVMGVAGFCGNGLAGRLADRFGSEAVIHVAIGSMLAAFGLWIVMFSVCPAPLGTALAVCAAVLWGSGNFAANSMQQVRLVNIAPPFAAVSVALNTSAIYLGQFFGAWVGGRVLTSAIVQPPSRALPLVGLPIFVAALLVSTSAQRRAERRALQRGPAGSQDDVGASGYGRDSG